MKVPDLSRKTEDHLFLIRPVDLDMSWNLDSADAFNVVVFSDIGVTATERYVAETGNLTGMFERPVLATDTVEPVAESLAGNAADSEPVFPDMMRSGNYDEVQTLTLIRVWSGLESEMITDDQRLAAPDVSPVVGQQIAFVPWLFSLGWSRDIHGNAPWK